MEYVKLCGLKHGRPIKDADSALLSLEEIAQQLGGDRKSRCEIRNLKTQKLCGLKHGQKLYQNDKAKS